MYFLKNAKWNKGLCITGIFILCVIVSVLMFGLNTLQAVALEQELRCDIEEHVHTDNCYDGDFLVCLKQAHLHDGNCYLILLNDNDINGVLSLIDENEENSLEYAIDDVVTTALVYNGDLNSSDSKDLSKTDVVALNETIANDDTIPNLTLNENLNTVSTLALGNTQMGNNVALMSVGDTPSTSNYDANFYIYLDGKWTCIGSIPFETVRNGNRYDSTIATSEVLELVNTTLGTEFAYNSFSISASSSLNGTYSTSNISVGSVTTTIAYRQQNTAARTAKYVRLIPRNGSANSTSFNFYTVKYAYPDGIIATRYVRSGTSVTLPDGNYQWSANGTSYAAGEVVTITRATTFTASIIGPITFININYDIAFPTVSGVTVSTKPTLAGLSVGTVTDGYTEGSSATLRNVSQQSVEGKVNNNSTGLSRVIQFKGWRVGNTDTVIQANTKLVWEELLQYANGASVNLTAVWEYAAVQTATFFIRFDSVAVDTNGNITGQDQNKYTKELFSAYVGGIDTSLSVTQLQNRYHIADTTADNSYGADQKIRALYGEQTDGVWLSAFPSDEQIFADLVQYAETGYLSVNGVAVKAQDLNNREYAIRWYVFKCQDDAWHIDGKLVKKEGLIHVYKTFAGNKALIKEAKEDFYIDAYNQADNTHTRLDLINYTTYDSGADKYMWEITNVDYGERWDITEHPHQFEDSSVEFHVYSEYTVMDAHGDQSISGTGTSLTVSGMTYALDEGIDEVLRAEFTNIYNKSDSIIIKKQDAITGVSIGGAKFQLLQNGKALKFHYNSETDSYEYDPTNGTETTLEGTATGYFEIFIEDFSYDLGPITVREVTPPDGYSPIQDVEIGYVGNDKTVGILSGNSELIYYVNGILIIGNSTETSTVTAKKTWDSPESEWQDVTVQLLANGKLVTTLIAGVDAQVVLNEENNWQHTWKNLPVYVNGAKIEWSIKETQVGLEACKSDGSFVNWLVSYELPIYFTDEDGNEHVVLTVNNTTKRVMLRLTKTNLNKNVQLPNATFLLEAVDVDGNVLSSEVVKTATTGEAGTLIFDNMKCGVRYRLTETVAPEGYLKLEEYIYFTINEDGSVTVEDSYYAEAGTTAYNIIVRNVEGIELPESGGAGTGMLYTMAMLLFVATAGIYINNLRKRRCYN